MFQREISSLMGGKFMQQMMNNSFELPKFACKGRFFSAINHSVMHFPNMNFVIDDTCYFSSAVLLIMFWNTFYRIYLSQLDASNELEFFQSIFLYFHS